MVPPIYMPHPAAEGLDRGNPALHQRTPAAIAVTFRQALAATALNRAGQQAREEPQYAAYEEDYDELDPDNPPPPSPSPEGRRRQQQDDAHRQWAGQLRPPSYVKYQTRKAKEAAEVAAGAAEPSAGGAKAGCYVGHFAENVCRTAPDREGLENLQPGQGWLL